MCTITNAYLANGGKDVCQNCMHQFQKLILEILRVTSEGGKAAEKVDPTHGIKTHSPFIQSAVSGA